MSLRVVCLFVYYVFKCLSASLILLLYVCYGWWWWWKNLHLLLHVIWISRTMSEWEGDNFCLLCGHILAHTHKYTREALCVDKQFLSASFSIFLLLFSPRIFITNKTLCNCLKEKEINRKKRGQGGKGLDLNLNCNKKWIKFSRKQCNLPSPWNSKRYNALCYPQFQH